MTGAKRDQNWHVWSVQPWLSQALEAFPAACKIGGSVHGSAVSLLRLSVVTGDEDNDRDDGDDGISSDDDDDDDGRSGPCSNALTPAGGRCANPERQTGQARTRRTEQVPSRADQRLGQHG